MARRNSHGIDRYIPAAVKREVRTLSGYGCVICRQAFCEYHHFDPEFHELTEPHSADGIALVCRQHHGELTAGRMKNAQVTRAYREGRDQGWPPCEYPMPFDPNLPIVVELGNYRFSAGSGWKLSVDGDEVLSIDTSDQGPVLSALLESGEVDEDVVRIEENTFIYPPEAVDDFEITGSWLKWRVNGRLARIEFATTEYSNRIKITGLDLVHNGVQVTANKNVLRIDHLDGLWTGTEQHLHYLNSGVLEVGSTGGARMSASATIVSHDWNDVAAKLAGKTWKQRLQVLADTQLSIADWHSSGFPDEAEALRESLLNSQETPNSVLSSVAEHERVAHLETLARSVAAMSRSPAGRRVVADQALQCRWLKAFAGHEDIEFPE